MQLEPDPLDMLWLALVKYPVPLLIAEGKE